MPQETTNAQVMIPLSKRKMILLLISSVVFVLAGIWLLLWNPSISNKLLNQPALKISIGIISILFFGWAGFILVKKLMDDKPGLIIGPDGIIDNSSGISAGFIPWSDITGIKIQHVFSQKFLMIIVRNPETYIGRQHGVKKGAAKANHKMYGSPVAISSNALQIRFEELKQLIDQRLVS
jgi:hypothetical protein